MPRAKAATPRRGRWKRRIVIIACLLLVIGVALLAAAPAIASRFVPGIISRAAGGSVNGTLSIGGASLGWFGPQRATGIVITDADGEKVADLSIESDAGLIGLVLGSRDLGSIAISGSIWARQDASGAWNLERLAKTSASGAGVGAPSAASPGPGPTLPKGLRAKVVADLAVQLADPDRGSVNFDHARVNAEYADGLATLTLSASAADSTTKPGGLGKIEGSITAGSIASPDGRLTLDAARFDATLEISNASTRLAELVSGTSNELAEAIGERVAITISAQGSASDARADVRFASEGLDADLAFAMKDRVITAARPGRVELDTSRLAWLIDAPRSAEITEYPRISLGVESFRLRAPSSGVMDWRGANVNATLGSTEAAARVVVPGNAVPSLARMAPLAIRVRSDDLAAGATITGGTRLTLDDQPAGELDLKVTAAGLIDASGAFTAGAPMLDGALGVRGVATVIAQPLADAMGLELAAAIGPSIDAELRASTPMGSSSSRVVLRVSSANLNAAGEALVEPDGSISTSSPVEVRIGSVAPFLAITPADGKVEILSGGGVVLRVSDARVKLGAYADGIDLREIGGVLTISSAPTTGVLRTARDAAPRPWEVAASSATIDARDLALVAFKGASSVTFEGKPAGTFTADGAASGLIDVAGRPRATPGAMRGKLHAKDVSTAMIQPVLNKLAPTLGLELPRDVGPSVSLLITADAVAETTGLTRTEIDASMNSDGVMASASLTLDQTGLRSRGKGVAVTAPAAGRIASVLFQRSAGIELEPAGSITLAIPAFDAPFTDADTIALDRLRADATLQGALLAARRLAPDGARGPRLELRGMDLAITLAPDAEPRLKGTLWLASEGDAFSIDTDVRVAGPWREGRPVPALASPLGTIVIKNAPPSLTGWAAKPGTDLTRVVTAAIGPAVSVSIESKHANEPGVVDLGVRVESASMNGAIVATLEPDAIELRSASLAATLSPAAARTLLESFAPESTARLAEPARVEAALSPLRIPREAWRLDMSRASAAAIELRAPGKVLLDGLQREDGASISPLGFESLQAKATIPIASFGTDSRAPAAAAATLSGRILGSTGVAGSIEGRVELALVGGKPSGPLSGALTLTDTDTGLIDALAASPGLVSGALGQRLSLTATVRGAIDSGVLSTLDATALVASERVTMSKPLAIKVDPSEASLVEPARLDWRVDPAWANRWLPRQLPREGEPPAPEVAIAEPILTRVDLWKLVIARAGAGPFKPGVFSLDARLAAPAISLESTGVITRFADVSARVQSGHAPGGVVGFSIETKGAGEGPLPERQGAIKLAGSIHGAVTDAGRLDASRAVITARGDAWNLPTPIIDALARQNGLLVDLLGPAMTVNVRAQGLSRSAGTIEARAGSTRASAFVRGSVRDGVFVSSEPIVATLVEITPEAGARLIRVLPLLGTFEKKPEDGPARVTVSGLELPIDGRLERLNGAMRIEVGTARFLTSGLFQAILLATDQRSQGMLGRRVEPINVTMSRGIVAYERFKVPVGEFSFETRGAVDLPRRSVDVIAYFPIGALTDEAAGVFNTNLGKNLTAILPGGLNRLTMVPYRISGPIQNPTSKPDLELFAREFMQQLRPDNFLKDLIGGGKGPG